MQLRAPQLTHLLLEVIAKCLLNPVQMIDQLSKPQQQPLDLHHSQDLFAHRVTKEARAHSNNAMPTLPALTVRAIRLVKILLTSPNREFSCGNCGETSIFGMRAEPPKATMAARAPDIEFRSIH